MTISRALLWQFKRRQRPASSSSNSSYIFLHGGVHAPSLIAYPLWMLKAQITCASFSLSLSLARSLSSICPLMDLEREREKERHFIESNGHCVVWSLPLHVVLTSSACRARDRWKITRAPDWASFLIRVTLSHTPFVSQFIHFKVVQLFKTNRKIKWLIFCCCWCYLLRAFD